MRSSASSHAGRYSHLVGRSDPLLLQALAKLDCRALGIAVGVWAGLGLFTATIFLLIKGAPFGILGLLGQYFAGYKVTWAGSIIGFGYGFLGGFCLGWLIAYLRNLCISIYLRFVRLTASMLSLDDL